MATPQQLGLVTPTGTDWIRDGDNAITKNAEVLAEWVTKIGRPTWGGKLPSPLNLANFRQTGIFMINSRAEIAQITGLPEGLAAAFTLLQFSSQVDPKQSEGSANQRLLLGTTENTGVWYQSLDLSKSSPGNYVWTPWANLHDSARPADDLSGAGLKNAIRKEAFIRRRGGKIGTGGKAVVCLRMDHGMTKLGAIVAPIAKKYQLPLSVGVFSKMLTSAARGDEDTGMTWVQIDQAASNQGWEIWNHSATHGAASGLAQLTAEIVTARDEIAAALPNSVIEGFIVPGTTGTAYDGFSTSSDPLRFSDTLAGQLILSSHAICTGSGGRYTPLGGVMGGNIPFTSIDSSSAAKAAINLVKDAQAYGSSLCLFLHPYVVDRNSGEATTSDIEALFAFLAAERDAGRLEVLTMGGAALADASTSWRHDLIRHDASRWQQTSGWAISEQARTYTGTASARLLKGNIDLSQHSYAKGAVVELYAEVKAPAGASVVGLRADTYPASPKLAASLDTPVPADSWQPVRLTFALPATASLVQVQAGRVSGGALTMRNLALRPV